MALLKYAGRDRLSLSCCMGTLGVAIGVICIWKLTAAGRHRSTNVIAIVTHGARPAMTPTQKGVQSV